MAITFVCPCGKHLRARDKQASRRVVCPRCGSPVKIPELDGPVPDTENWTARLLNPPSVKTPDAEPIGPIFFRARPYRADPNRELAGRWKPLDDKDKLPPAEGARRRKRTRRQIAWRLETNWWQCLLYPFRAWPLVVGLGAGLGMFASQAAAYLAQLSEPTAEGVASWTVAVGLLGLGIVSYTIGFLDCVLGSAAAGEYRHVRWPERSMGLVVQSCLTWLLCFCAGPLLFVGAAFAYWLYGGDPDLGDQLIVGELSAVGSGYWLLAILASAEGRRAVTGPQAVADLFRRLGVGFCAALLAALTLAFVVGRFAINALEEFHRSWFSGGFLLGCAGVAGVYLAVFFLRYLGIRAFHTRPAALGNRRG